MNVREERRCFWIKDFTFGLSWLKDVRKNISQLHKSSTCIPKLIEMFFLPGNG